MKLGIKRAALLAIATVGLVVASGTPAQSATGASAVVVAGSGSINPGITTGQAQQSWNFTSVTIVTAGVAVATGSSTCNAGGTSATTLEDVLVGGGTGTWSCNSGVLVGCGGPLVFVRTATIVQVTISGNAGTCAGVTGQLTCQFTPTNANPTTQYQLACAGEIHDT